MKDQDVVSPANIPPQASDVSRKSTVDTYNSNAMKVLNNEGPDEFVKHVFTDQDDPNKERQMSYAEMRMRYG